MRFVREWGLCLLSFYNSLLIVFVYNRQRKMKLNQARVHAKLGNIDEAIEILGDFENSPDADVNKTIVRV